MEHAVQADTEQAIALRWVKLSQRCRRTHAVATLACHPHSRSMDLYVQAVAQRGAAFSVPASCDDACNPSAHVHPVQEDSVPRDR